MINERKYGRKTQNWTIIREKFKKYQAKTQWSGNNCSSDTIIQKNQTQPQFPINNNLFYFRSENDKQRVVLSIFSVLNINKSKKTFKNLQCQSKYISILNVIHIFKNTCTRNNRITRSIILSSNKLLTNSNRKISKSSDFYLGCQ